MTGSRPVPGAVVLAVVLAAFALLVSTAGPWVTGALERPPPLPPEQLTAGAPAGVRALGLVVLAAAPALLAARGRARQALGGVLVLAGAGAALSTAVLLAGPAAALPTDAPVAAEVTARPFLALPGALLALGSGGVVVTRGRGWSGLGRRHERAAAPGAAAAGTEQVDAVSAWDALDRGEDPTGR